MKVLLFSGYGGYACTKAMLDIMKKHNNIRSRFGEIVEYVENNCVDYNRYDYEEAYKAMKNNKDLIVRYVLGNNECRYSVWDNNINNPACFSIVDVDTTRPWTIEEYDGAEYIKYLDERKLVDEELNYWE